MYTTCLRAVGASPAIRRAPIYAKNRPMVQNNQKTVIGSEEWCAFPDLGIPAIKARIDTGAKTSSIHAFNIQKFVRNDEPWVSFEVHPLQNDRRTVIRCERPIHDKRVVKSSSGIPENRYVVLASLRIGTDIHDIELTLANRDSMGYRMLLGREALNNRMIVDTSLSLSLGDIPGSVLNEHYAKCTENGSGLRIGLLASNPELYSNLRIIEAGEERGHDMEFLDIRQCYMKLDTDEPEAHYLGSKVRGDLDAVIPRIRPDLTYYGCALTRQFESMGILAMNTSSSISQSRDKLYSLQLLVKNGISIPASGFANYPADVNDLIDIVGGAPLIVKLLEPGRGKGMVLAKTRKEAESVINSFRSKSANLLVQEYIQEAQGKTLRCFVIGRKVVAAIQRKTEIGASTSSRQRGDTVSTVKITPAERAMAVKAVKILGLSIAGVDIIRSQSGPLLLKVNSSPELKGMESVTGKDIAGKMIAAIEKKLGWKPGIAAMSG